MNKSLADFFEDRWREKAGYPPKVKFNIDELRKTEWSDRFEQLMRNRLIVGAFRYGKLHDKSKGTWNRQRAMMEKLILYKITGNDELLVDIANCALLEFEEGMHPNKHFCATDDKNHVFKIGATE